MSVIATDNLYQTELLQGTLSLVSQVFESICTDITTPDNQMVVAKIRNLFVPGKLLRTRLAWSLYSKEWGDLQYLTTVCAATELVHVATLFHDDVIDGALIRRGKPSLWREIGSTGAILIGDLFFSGSVQLLATQSTHNRLLSFLDKVKEICTVEMSHELIFRGHELDVDTCLQIARGKTGPLFAFVAESCASEDPDQITAYREAGYHLGTAYQLADDWLDITGNEERLGKTLGTDIKRHKYTLAQDNSSTPIYMSNKINELCNSALKQLRKWPVMEEKLEQYIVMELLPFWKLDIKLCT